jgi:energy-coupling factor transport system ATP-binding protein
MAQLALNNISFKYSGSQTFALKDINLSLKSGQFTLITGHDGAGKTTLSYVLKGIIPNVFEGSLQGEQTLNQKHLQEYTHQELTKKIGYVFQNPWTQLSMIKTTVEDELSFSCENVGFSREESKFRVKAITRLLGLNDLVKKNPIHLSIGQLQTVALGTMLVLDPDVLILDEPTSQLDPSTRRKLFHHLSDLKKQGKTIVLIEHNIDDFLEIVDHLVILENGSITDQGTVEDVYSRALNNKKDIQYPSLTSLLSTITPLDKPILNDCDALEILKELESHD